MKKSSVFLILSLPALIFFACDFPTLPNPTAIEIVGTPTVRFAETVEIGSMFTDLIDEAIQSDDKMSVFPCKQTEYLTYLIHMDLFSSEFDAIEHPDEIDNLYEYFPGMNITAANIGYELTENKMLIDGSDDPMILPLSEIGSVLNGFEFSKYKTKLYFSGSPLVSKAKVDIIIEEGGDDGYTPYRTIENISIPNKISDIEKWKEDGEYKEKECPSGGVEINIPIKGKDIAVSFKVYIPAGETLYLDDFAAGDIKVEVVVWLPFIFEAGEDGAEIAFPENTFFDHESDLFGREEPGAESLLMDIVESMSVSIKFDNALFKDSDLIVESKGVEVHNPVKDNTLSFSLTEDDMKNINKPENWPFSPNLKIKFNPGKELGFPRILNATEFSIKAKVRYRIDLQSDEDSE